MILGFVAGSCWGFCATDTQVSHQEFNCMLAIQVPAGQSPPCFTRAETEVTVHYLGWRVFRAVDSRNPVEVWLFGWHFHSFWIIANAWLGVGMAYLSFRWRPATSVAKLLP